MFANKKFNGNAYDESQHELLCDVCGQRLGAHHGLSCEKISLKVCDKPNKYKRTVPSTTIDIYDVLQAWQVTNPAIQHAIKKLLQPGQRGHKTRAEDLQEALVSIERAMELERV